MQIDTIITRSRDTAAVGLFRATGTAKKAVDPILVAIARFETAWQAAAAAYDLSRRAWAQNGASVPAGTSVSPFASAHRGYEAALARLKAAGKTLVATRPTTLAGLAAALDLVADGAGFSFQMRLSMISGLRGQPRRGCTGPARLIAACAASRAALAATKAELEGKSKSNADQHQHRVVPAALLPQGRSQPDKARNPAKEEARHVTK